LRAWAGRLGERLQCPADVGVQIVGPGGQGSRVGGPRMGPIFGGMLLSGQKLAAAVHAALHDAPATAASDE